MWYADWPRTHSRTEVKSVLDSVAFHRTPNRISSSQPVINNDSLLSHHKSFISGQKKCVGEPTCIRASKSSFSAAGMARLMRVLRKSLKVKQIIPYRSYMAKSSFIKSQRGNKRNKHKSSKSANS